MAAGFMPQQDGRDEKGRPFDGGITIIRNMMSAAGLSQPADPIFHKAWMAYERLWKKSPFPYTTVVERRDDGTPVTLGECWVNYTLKPALKDAIKRMQGFTDSGRN